MNEFPEEIRFNQKPFTKFYDSKNNIKITLESYPMHDFRWLCYCMIQSTWKDTPEYDKSKVSNLEIDTVFKQLLSFKVLPNSMEHLNFVFKVEGLTHIDITHLLRHRTFHSIHAQCSGDRFLTLDSAFIPSSISNSIFNKKYRQLTKDAKQLYQDMVDSKAISLMDARYILTRNHRYFYYFGANLKDLINFINQRKCTMVQPEIDNILAHQIYDKITRIIPELKETLSLECNNKCAYINSPNERNTRLYNPDEIHQKYIKHSSPSVYNKTRKELGINGAI